MKILVMADHESKLLYDFYEPSKLKEIDLIISCGDLRHGYLDFFASVAHAPVLYVMGNHDTVADCEKASGCICIEDDIFEFQGIRIMGLGGSMRYIPDADNQYTEQQMQKRIRKLRYKLWRKKGFDILVTHAPAYQLNDMDDLPHRGFACFRELLEKYRPSYFLHGHVHANYGDNFKRKDTFGDTMIVNAYEYYVIDYPKQQEAR